MTRIIVTCEACERASSKPTGLYLSKCKECQKRHLAQSLSFWQAQQAGRMLPAYKKALEAVFGDEWKAGHEAVKNHRVRVSTDCTEARN